MHIELGPEPSGPPVERWNDRAQLSDAERQRRWELVATIIAEHSLDALVIFQSNADAWLRYAEWAVKGTFRNAGAVLFRPGGDVFAYGVADFSEPWVGNSIRPHEDLGARIAETIAAETPSPTRIGTIGAHRGEFGLNEFTSQGLGSYATVAQLVQSLPGSQLVDVTADLARAMLVKSPEEIVLVEGAAAAGERLQEHVLAALVPGRTFRQFKAIVASYAAINDLLIDVQVVEFPRPALEPGDVVNTEFGVLYKGGYAQVTLAAAVGEPTEIGAQLAAVAQDALAVAEKTARAGITFGELVGTVQDVIDESGFWHGFPLVHSLAPLSMVGRLAVTEPGSPEDYLPVNGPDEVLREGMTLSFEVGARSGFLDQVKLGGTVVVQSDGVRWLNSLGRRLQIVA